MDPFTIASLAISGGQAVGGLIQMAHANKNKPKQPKYEIPQSAKTALDLTRRRSNSPTMPGESEMIQDLEQSSATALETGKRTGDFASIMDVLKNQDTAASKSISEMALQRANYRLQTEAAYKDALNQYAGYEDKKWEWEKGRPYLDKLEQNRANAQSGMNNMMTGIQSGLQTGAAAYSANKETERYKMMYDRYGDAPQPS